MNAFLSRTAFLALLSILLPTVCAAAVPTTVYAGGAGVFKSSDGGVTWQTIGSGLGSVLSVAIDPKNPNIIYAGTDLGAFKTINGGANWSAINNGLVLVSGNPPWHSAVTVIVIDPSNSTTLYAGTGRWGNGVFKSTNGGANWSAMNNGLVTNGNLDVRGMAIDPLNPTTLYLTGVTGLSSAKTINGGALWTPVSALAFGFAAVVDPINPANVYFSGPFGISKSSDSGATWSPIINGLTNTFVLSLAVDPSLPTTLYAGTGGGVSAGAIFRSNDGGGHWSLTGGGLAGSRDVFALAVDPADRNTVYAGGTQGVFKSTDGGVTWNVAFASTSIQSLAMQPSTPETRIYSLIADVERLASATGPLTFGQGNALVKKLENALSSLNGKPKVACNQLSAFLNQLRALEQSGQLATAQGAVLISQAQLIMQSIPCAP